MNGFGVVDFLLNKRRKSKVKEQPELYPKIRLLYPNEFHVDYHSFTGPGTKLDEEVLYTDNRRAGIKTRDMKPFNNIDRASKVHDLEYEQIFNSNLSVGDKMKLIRQADLKALEEYNKHRNEHGYDLAYNGILNKIRLEDRLATSLLRKLFGNYVGSN